MNWIPFTRTEQIKEVAQKSQETPVVIFKHSTTCPISSIAKHRVESSWSFSENEVTPFYLDLLAYRQVSNGVAKQLQVHHESPQIIVLWKGEVLLDASHLDISVDEIKEVLASEKSKK